LKKSSKGEKGKEIEDSRMSSIDFYGRLLQENNQT
jgi:hypothetical protein